MQIEWVNSADQVEEFIGTIPKKLSEVEKKS